VASLGRPKNDAQSTAQVAWLLLLSAAEVATMITFASYTAAQPLLQREWSMSSAQAGGIFAAQQAGYAVAVLILSSLTDLIGVRPIYLISALWNTVAAAGFALGATNFGSAAVLRALIGVGLAGTYMPGMRLVAETFPTRRRGAALGVYISCFGVGVALSLFVSGRLLFLGTREMLLATAAGPLAAVAIGWAVVHDVSRRGRAPLRLPSFGVVLRNREAMRFIGAYAAHNWELFGMRAWLPVFLTYLWTTTGMTLGAATRLGSTAGSAILLVGAFSNAAGGWLSDHLGRRRTIALFLGASGGCSALIGWLGHWGLAAVLPAAVAYGLLVTADSSTLSTAVAEHARPEALGTTMAVQSSIGFVAPIISPVLFGLILDAWGWGYAFLSLAAAAFGGVVLALSAGKGAPTVSS
jgi:MFS family permease